MPQSRVSPSTVIRGRKFPIGVDVGFITQRAEAEHVGTKFNVDERGSSNRGHEYGTNLGAAEKDALIEYLKTL
jgi:hypothetical protein